MKEKNDKIVWQASNKIVDKKPAKKDKILRKNILA